jgi:enolase
MKVLSIWAREILDSRGNPTVEVELYADNAVGTAAAPSGASTGIHEVHELRDGGERYGGKGVKRAVENVNSIISDALTNQDFRDPASLDSKLLALDGTPDKKTLGANAIVATSMAAIRAFAASKDLWLHEYLGGSTLPFGMFNIINGGKHAQNGLAVQEFMIIPEQESFAERLRAASEIYHVLGKILVSKHGPSSRNVGDEGGYAPPIDNSYKALDSIVAAIEEAGYSDQCSIGLDAAASSFCTVEGKEKKECKYAIDGKTLRENEMIDYYIDLTKTYKPLKSLEDPFHEESFDAFAALLRELPHTMIVGDDLTVTNPVRLREAISRKSINTLLLKVNQIGTVTEALEAVRLCKENNIMVIVSHRSGETEDCFPADFAVGIGAGYLKAGAPARGERTAKYNQLLRIEEHIRVQSLVERLKAQEQ